MRRVTGIILLSLRIAVPVAGQEPDELIVTERSKTSLVLEFRPRYSIRTVTGASGEQYVVYEFRGSLLPEGTPGKPMIPYRAFPLDGTTPGFSIQVLEAHYDDVEARIAPYPSFRRDKEWGANPEYGSLRSSDDRFDPAVIAEIVDIAGGRGVYRATLKISPVQHNSTRRLVRLYDRIRLKVVMAGGPAGLTQRSAPSDSPLKGGQWYKMDIQETGIYKLDQQFFSQLGMSTGDLRYLRIFGNGGEELPENLAATRPNGLQEISRFVFDQNNDHTLDANDFILFYGKSPRGWKYNPASKTFSHTLHHYTEANSYFMTFGDSLGRQMDSIPSLNTAAYIAPDFQAKVLVEEERFNLINSGRQWYGQRVDAGSPVTISTNVFSGYVPTGPTRYRVALLARSPRSETFQIQEAGSNPASLLGNIFTPPTDVNSIENNYAYQAPVATFTRSGTLSGDRSIVRISLENPGPSSVGWLDWIEIFYRSRFEAAGDQLLFTSPDTTAIVEYALSGFSSRDVYAFDVTEHDSVRRIINLGFSLVSPDSCSFQLSEVAGGVREMIVVGPGGLKTPLAPQRVDNTNLHGVTGGAEFVIVTPKEFRVEADRLKAYREQHDTLTVLVANIEDIFNEWSGGLADPMAVRDFLNQARQTWVTPPKYLLLFGNGHFDYKNIRTQKRNWIPPYETLESIHQISSYASDDYLGMFTPGDTRVSLGIGRLPITSVLEAREIVDRIIAYETAAPFDSWRNRATFVADDGLTSTGDEGSLHTSQSELLAQSFTPASVEKKKIFIVEYPTVNSSAGRRKPTANTAIIDAINTGTLMLNYTGHGNPELWAHEAVFTRESGLPLLTNKDRLTFLVAATCDYARYDNPTERSAGEELLFLERGGAIGVVTASRAVYSAQNSTFNNTLYVEIFRRGSGGSIPRLGDAMLRTKQILYSENDLKYHLLADPTMKLDFPRNFVGVDSINGLPLTGVATVAALSRVQVAGEIRRPDNSPWTDFSGRALFEMFDSRRRVVIPEWGNYSFEVNGGLLYRGEVTVTQGAFRVNVPIPKDVSYDNNRARISVYAWNNTVDAVGFTENLVIAGTDSTAAVDTSGPQLQVFLEDESFRSGSVVTPDPILIAKVFDQSGVNTSTAGVGHRLEAVLSSNPQQPIDLTESYRNDLDTYQSGTVRYQLHGLKEGHQTLLVKAWDVYNNSSQNEVSFDVQSASDLAMYNVFNFPNPVRTRTTFTFQRNSAAPVDVQIKIYTLVGRLIQEITTPPVLDRFVQVGWDGRDRNGDEIANGIYFYKIVLRSSSGQQASEVVGKLTMMR